jgi:probable HAF family extracellular repeat protein
MKGDIGGINASGTIAGTATNRRIHGQRRRGHLHRRPDSSARAINARGEIVGTSNGRAFLYANGAARDLGTLAATAARRAASTRAARWWACPPTRTARRSRSSTMAP